MTRDEKKHTMQAPAIAGTYQFGGVEIVGTEYGTEDYMLYRCPVLGHPRPHRAQVHYETSRPYIHVYGRRLHLDEIEIYSQIRGQRVNMKIREEAGRHETE